MGIGSNEREGLLLMPHDLDIGPNPCPGLKARVAAKEIESFKQNLAKFWELVEPEF